MPRLIVALVTVALVITGGLLAWPQVRGWWLYQRTTARILDVLPTTRSDGNIDLAIVYEYELPTPVKPGERSWVLGWRIGDAYFRTIPDPVVEPERIEQVTRELLDADEPNRHLRQVFFSANDPEGTAFILDETAAVPANRLQIGTVLMAIGLLAGFYAWRRGADT